MAEHITLGFHDVVEDLAGSQPIAAGHTNFYTLERRGLRSHLEAIRACAGRDAVGRIDGFGGGSNRSVSLTFDDGALGSFSCAAEELDRLGWLGHFFIITDWIGRPGFMDRRQIRELHDRGHLIGSHSCSHPQRISHLPWREQVHEWWDSAAALADIVGHPVTAASVPGGYYSEALARAAASAGIGILFTSEPTARTRTVDTCAVLGRYTVRRHTPAAVTGAIAAGEAGPRAGQASAWFCKKILKSLTGRWYEEVRGMLVVASESRPGRA